MAHVLVDISAHGLGHLAQTAPVLNALATRLRPLDLTVRSGIAEERLRLRIKTSFDHIAAKDGFGLVMTSPFVVNIEATVARYQELHSELKRHVETIGADLRRRSVDLVVSNVSYPVLMGARLAGIPSFTFGSINWHHVLHHYCGDAPGMAEVLAEIASAYRGTDEFLRLAPGIAMPEIATRVCREPIVALGRARDRELRMRFGLDATAPILVFGFDSAQLTPPLTLATDPALRPGRQLLLGPKHWRLPPPWVGFEDAGIGFLDALASATLVIAKPGYGMVTEAAAAKVPLLLLGRRDWPETTAFLDWIDRRAPYRHLDLTLDALRWSDITPLLGEQPAFGTASSIGGGEIEVAQAICEMVSGVPGTA